MHGGESYVEGRGRACVSVSQGGIKMDEITPNEVRNIRFKKGASFSTGFIRKFEKEWGEVREAARRIREKDENG